MDQQPSPSSTISFRNLRLIGIVSLIILLATVVIGVLVVNAQTNTGGETLVTAGSPEQIQLGKQLFTEGTADAAACSLCHTLDGVTLVGPSLQHIAATAATRVQGQSAQDYIRASILNPTVYKVEGFESGSMAPNYAAILTPEETDALIAFLMTQE
jgi:mono/diheme cytochrome c family protein